MSHAARARTRRRPALDVEECLTFLKRLESQDPRAYELGAADLCERLHAFRRTEFRLPYQNHKELVFLVVCNIVLNGEGSKQPSQLRGAAHRVLNSALVEEYQDVPSSRCSVCFAAHVELHDVFWGEKCMCEACERVLCLAFSKATRGGATGYEFCHLPLGEMVPTFRTLFGFNHHKAYYTLGCIAAAADTLVDVREGRAAMPLCSDVAAYSSSGFHDDEEEGGDELDSAGDAADERVDREDAPAEDVLERAPSLGVEALRALLGAAGVAELTRAPQLADLVAARTAVAFETANDFAARVRRAAEEGVSAGAAAPRAETLGEVIAAATAIAETKAGRLHATDVGELMETVKRAKRSIGDACDALVDVLEKLR